MAIVKIELELIEEEIPNLMIAKKMAEKDTGMKLSFTNFFRVAYMNYIANRPRVQKGNQSPNLNT